MLPPPPLIPDRKGFDAHAYWSVMIRMYKPATALLEANAAERSRTGSWIRRDADCK